MNIWRCDNCGKELERKSGWRVTRQGRGMLFMPMLNVARHAAEENEQHVCSSRCAVRLLEVSANPHALTDAEIASGVQA